MIRATGLGFHACDHQVPPAKWALDRTRHHTRGRKRGKRGKERMGRRGEEVQLERKAEGRMRDGRRLKDDAGIKLVMNKHKAEK